MSKAPAPGRLFHFGCAMLLVACCVASCLSLVVGCSSGSMTTTPPPVLAGNSTVVVLMSATANDKLVNFSLGLTSMSLTDTAGNSVTLASNTNHNPTALRVIEFMHLANHPTPLVTMSIPQGMYTSASVKVGYCSFTNVFFDASTTGLTESTYAQGLCSQGTGNAAVN